MPTGLHWKSLLVWIAIAVALVLFFNWVPELERTMGPSDDFSRIIINWFPMLLLVGVWIFFIFMARTGKWTYVSPAQKEQTEALKAAVTALERIAKALETRRL